MWFYFYGWRRGVNLEMSTCWWMAWGLADASVWIGSRVARCETSRGFSASCVCVHLVCKRFGSLRPLGSGHGWKYSDFRLKLSESITVAFDLYCIEFFFFDRFGNWEVSINKVMQRIWKYSCIWIHTNNRELFIFGIQGLFPLLFHWISILH